MLNQLGCTLLFVTFLHIGVFLMHSLCHRDSLCLCIVCLCCTAFWGLFCPCVDVKSCASPFPIFSQSQSRNCFQIFESRKVNCRTKTSRLLCLRWCCVLLSVVGLLIEVWPVVGELWKGRSLKWCRCFCLQICWSSFLRLLFLSCCLLALPSRLDRREATHRDLCALCLRSLSLWHLMTLINKASVFKSSLIHLCWDRDPRDYIAVIFGHSFCI